jgi:hypothetical protein
MPQESPIVRQERLQNLARFCEALVEALKRAGTGAEAAAHVIQRSVSARCVGCEILISGLELFALSQPPSPEHASPKIGRLRLGDCARQTCEAYDYRLTFQPDPLVDWNKILADADAIVNAPPTESAPARTGPVLPHWLLRGVSRRIWIPVTAAVLLLLLRQWYVGGRIPLVREPEKFRVDPDPQEGSGRQDH